MTTVANRSVRVILEADTSRYESGLKRAADATAQVGDSAQKAKADTDKLDGSLGEVAKREVDIGQLGTTLAVAGGAAVALVGSVAATGIAYNTLQQTSRAALETMLGSAQAVNQQMAELDEFATTSPFSKAVFLEAQQQMLAFGIETEKVVPYLDAIQDSVAAAGGNNQQVGELAFIMAQISSASKITAQDLLQFGQRGVNAAELIGSQMGMTAAEIRDSITAGTLDADAALDALAAGMAERFDGAAENVKDTMEGAFDRVSAAWRDLSATIMEPLVDPTGGGFLVDAANLLADLMRWIGDLDPLILQLVTGMTGLAGAAALAVGGVVKLTPAIINSWDAFKALNVEHPKLVSGLGKVGMAAGIAAAAIAGLQIVGAIARTFKEEVVTVEQVLQDLEGAANAVDITGLDRAFRASGDASQQLWNDIDGISDAFAALEWSNRWENKLYLDIESAIGAVAGLEGRLPKLEKAIEAVDIAMSQLSFPDMSASFRELEAELEGTEYTAEELEERLPDTFAVIRRQLEEASGDWGSYGQSAQSVAAVLRGDLPHGLVLTEQGLMHASQAFERGLDYTDRFGESVKIANVLTSEAADQGDRLAESYNGWTVEQNALREAAQAAATEVRNNGGTFEDVQAAVEEAAAAYAEMRNAIADSSSAFIDIGGTISSFVEDAIFDFDAYLEALEEQVEAQANWETNMLLLAESASDGLISHLASLGPEGAPLVQALVDGTEDELAQMEAIFSAQGEASTRAFADELLNAEAVWAALAQRGGQEAVDAVKAEFETGGITLADVIEQWDLEATLIANGAQAERDANQTMVNVRAIMGDPVAIQTRVAQENAVRQANNLRLRIAGIFANPIMATVTSNLVGQRAGGGPIFSAPRIHPVGMIHGPGTSTSDSIPTMLSDGEFVHRASAVSHYGQDVMWALNARQVSREALRSLLPEQYRRMRDGGSVTATPVRYTAAPAPELPAIQAGAQNNFYAYGTDPQQVAAEMASQLHHQERSQMVPRR